MKINILGIGKIGCNVASWFKQYPKQYRTFFVDSKKYSNKSLLLSECQSFVEYEEKCPDFSSILGKVKGEVFVFLSGTNKDTGVTLKVLENIKDCKITIVYVLTETDNNLIFGVLQEYCRSGVFDSMIIFSNKNIEKFFDGIPVAEYYTTINNYIANLVDNLNYFNHNKSIFSHSEKPLAGARLTTISVVDLEERTEKNLFELDLVAERRYILGVSKEVLEGDKGLLGKVKEYMMSVGYNSEQQKISVSYAIYEMEEGKNVELCLVKSPVIQLNKR
jgi:hypothetical protein